MKSPTNARPRRILNVMATLNQGGAEQLVMNLLRTADPAEMVFEFVVNSSPDKYAHEVEVLSRGSRIHRLPDPKTEGVWALRRAWGTLLKNEPRFDVVHVHHTGTLFLYADLIKSYGLPIVTHSHSESRGRGLGAAAKRLARRRAGAIADRRIACSHTAGVQMYGTHHDFTTVRNGVQLDQLSFNQDSRRRLREDMGFGNALVLGHVGRFQEVKNHKFLVRVFEALVKRCPNSLLVLVGDGELMSDTRTLVKSLDLNDSVLFLGNRNDIPGLLAAFDAFAMPSLYEGLSVALIEAQSSGLPCFITDSLSDESETSDHVFRIPLTSDPDIWAASIQEKAPNSDSDRIATLAHVRAGGFDINSTVRELAAIYTDVLEDPSDRSTPRQ